MVLLDGGVVGSCSVFTFPPGWSLLDVLFRFLLLLAVADEATAFALASLVDEMRSWAVLVGVGAVANDERLANVLLVGILDVRFVGVVGGRRLDARLGDADDTACAVV
jgi:hypothetical protein